MFGNMFQGGSGIFGQTSDIGGQMSGVLKQQQEANASGQRGISSAFSGFTPQFYDKAQQGYVNNYLPSLEQQGLQASKQLGFDMANRGLYTSGAFDTGQQHLSGQLSQGRQGITADALAYRNHLQMQNEMQRAQMMQQLQSSMAPYGQAQSLLGQAGAMGTPNPMQPLMGFAGSIGGMMQGGMAGGK